MNSNHRFRTLMQVAQTLTLVAGMAATASAQQLTVPDRPARPLFRGQQGQQRSSEIAFDSGTSTVTLKLSVQDVHGYFIPKLRRNNFAVFEDGIRQNNVTVEVEHSPITLGVLMEMGGRSQQLNKTLASEGTYVVKPILEVLGRNDKLGVFTYDERLHTIVDFDTSHDKWDAAFSNLPASPFSEANFYDATIQLLDRMAALPGRKALLIISTGIDTFSHATFDDVRVKAEATETPIYVIGLGEMARQSIIDTSRGPLARVDWAECERQLETLARASGGRAYGRTSPVGVPAIYDDIMENLRVRYVVTYVSPQSSAATRPHLVQVRLVDPATGAPLQIVDASGRRVTAQVIAQASYTPVRTGA